MSEMENKAGNASKRSARSKGAGDKKDDKGLGQGIILFVVAFVVFFAGSSLLFPKLLYSKKDQPFNFDHKLHTYEAGDCYACHFLREDGSYSGIPKLKTCGECHPDTAPLGVTRVKLCLWKNIWQRGKKFRGWYMQGSLTVSFSPTLHTLMLLPEWIALIVMVT
jgi:hypothetical protein